MLRSRAERPSQVGSKELQDARVARNVHRGAAGPRIMSRHCTLALLDYDYRYGPTLTLGCPSDGPLGLAAASLPGTSVP